MKFFFLYHLRVWRVPWKREMEKIFGFPAKTVENNFFLYLLWLMTGAFGEGEGENFGSPAKTVKMEFFCIFYAWSGRLLGRRRIIFSISSKKKTDNFLYFLRRRWRRHFFSQRLLLHNCGRNNSRLLVWNILFPKETQLKFTVFPKLWNYLTKVSFKKLHELCR